MAVFGPHGSRNFRLDRRRGGRAPAPSLATKPGPGAAQGTSGGPAVLDAVRGVLAARGYQPYEDPDGTVRPGNCPFDRIPSRHPELVCGINLAMLQGMVEQLGDHGIRPALDPAPKRRCVALARL
jgi:hypothetical protein